jgi:hypothetical protein
MNALIFSTLVTPISELDPSLEHATTIFLSYYFGESNLFPKKNHIIIKKALFYAYQEWAIEIARHLADESHTQEALVNLLTQYKKALNLFFQDINTIEIFLQPFLNEQLTAYTLNVHHLSQRWQKLSLTPLPEYFDPTSVSEIYLRQIKKIGIVPLFKYRLMRGRLPYLKTLYDTWLDLDLERYAQQIREHHETLALPIWKELQGAQVQLVDIFVPQQAIKMTRKERQHTPTFKHASTELKPKAESIFIILSKPEHRKLVFLGTPGLGKSTLVRYLLLNLLKPALDNEGQVANWLRPFAGCLPFWIELSDYVHQVVNQHCHGLDHYICDWFETRNYLSDVEHFKQQLKERPILVIFDGLDRIFDSVLREEITQEIIDFSNEHPKARLIVTTRPIGYQGRGLETAGFREYILQELKREQVKFFIHRWFNGIYTDKPGAADFYHHLVNNAVENSIAIPQLASHPWLLTMMLLSIEQQLLPQGHVGICEYFAQRLYQHWELVILSPLPVAKTQIVLEELKFELLHRIAKYIQTTAHTYPLITVDALQHEIENYFSTRWQLPAMTATQFSHHILAHLKEKVAVFCFQGADYYGFIHPLFLEYFYAAGIVYHFEKQQTLSFETLKNTIFMTHYQEDNWAGILKLICGMLAPRFSGALIDLIIPAKEAAYVKTADLILAIQCLAEVTDLNQITSTAVRTLESLCSWFEITMKNNLEQASNEELQFAIHAVPAIETIGAHWPGKKTWLPWLAQIGQQVYLHNRSEWSTFIRTIVALWPQEETTKEILITLIRTSKTAGIASLILPFSSLVHHFGQQEEVKQFIKQCAQHDKQGNIRKFSVSFLANYYTYAPDTLPLLQQIATQDINNDVRCTALNALAKHYAHLSNIQSLLQEISRVEKDRYVRHAAINALIRHYADSPTVQQLLEQKVIEDKDSDIRCLAAKALAKQIMYNTTASRLSLLQQVALHDLEAKVRSYALGGIVGHYNDIWQKLLSKYLDGRALWLDPKEPIDEKRVDKAAFQLGLPAEIIREHYQKIAQEIPLQLTWVT